MTRRDRRRHPLHDDGFAETSPHLLDEDDHPPYVLATKRGHTDPEALDVAVRALAVNSALALVLRFERGAERCRDSRAPAGRCRGSRRAFPRRREGEPRRFSTIRAFQANTRSSRSRTAIPTGRLPSTAPKSACVSLSSVPRWRSSSLIVWSSSFVDCSSSFMASSSSFVARSSSFVVSSSSFVDCSSSFMLCTSRRVARSSSCTASSSRFARRSSARSRRACVTSRKVITAPTKAPVSESSGVTSTSRNDFSPFAWTRSSSLRWTAQSSTLTLSMHAESSPGRGRSASSCTGRPTSRGAMEKSRAAFWFAETRSPSASTTSCAIGPAPEDMRRSFARAASFASRVLGVSEGAVVEAECARREEGARVPALGARANSRSFRSTGAKRFACESSISAFPRKSTPLGLSANCRRPRSRSCVSALKYMSEFLQASTSMCGMGASWRRS